MSKSHSCRDLSLCLKMYRQRNTKIQSTTPRKDRKSHHKFSESSNCSGLTALCLSTSLPPRQRLRSFGASPLCNFSFIQTTQNPHQVKSCPHMSASQKIICPLACSVRCAESFLAYPRTNLYGKSKPGIFSAAKRRGNTESTVFA